MRTVKLRANVNNEFAVWPPVAAAEQPLYFRVTCTRPPDAVRFGADDIPGCTHHEALLNYIRMGQGASQRYWCAVRHCVICFHLQHG